MNYLIRHYGLEDQIICDSAGTSSYHIGSPPDRRMTAAAAKRGIRLEGTARQFEPTDLEEFDLILAMDKDNYYEIVRFDRTGDYQDKVKLMCEFCREHGDREVPDPYYGGPEGFNYVIDLLLDACKGLLVHVAKTQDIKRTPSRDREL